VGGKNSPRARKKKKENVDIPLGEAGRVPQRLEASVNEKKADWRLY